MQDKYCEQNVTQADSKKYEKRAMLLNIVRRVFLALGILTFIFAVYSGIIPSGAGPLQIALTLILLFIPSVISFLLYFYLTRLRNNTVLAFDYYLNGREFYIVKVFNNIKRKKFFACDIGEMSAIGLVDGENHDRAVSTPGIKKVNAFANVDSEDLRYALVNNSAGKTMLYFEPNGDFIRAIRMTLGKDIVEKEAK